MFGLSPQALQFVGSLVAILLLAWLVRKLGLGAAPRLSHESDAVAAASEVHDGFAPVDVAIDTDGTAALLRDTAGRIMVLKQHGVHFAGRILTPAAKAAEDGASLVVDSGEERFGAVSLRISDAEAWVDAIDALDKADDA